MGNLLLQSLLEIEHALGKKLANTEETMTTILFLSIQGCSKKKRFIPVSNANFFNFLWVSFCWESNSGIIPFLIRLLQFEKIG